MFQNTGRVDFMHGIKFYEQDILYDDYLYSGNIDIDLSLDYNNPGFGITLIGIEGNSITKNHSLMFKLGSGVFEIFEKTIDNKLSLLFNYSVSNARCGTKDLHFKVSKRDNKYSIVIGDLTIDEIALKVEMDTYYIGFYSNKDNVINNINIAASVPYNWNINMTNTNGGYILFKRDSFELQDCLNNAEVEQLNIELPSGTYYLKYNASINSDIKAYIMYSEDQRINDDEKNILKFNNKFVLENKANVSLKFVGTVGKINNITITTEIDNDYLRTDILTGDSKFINGSYIKFLVNEIQSFSFKGTIKFAPGDNHYNPLNYAIIAIGKYNYGLNDLNLSEGIEYTFKYKNGVISVIDSNNITRYEMSVGLNSSLTMFKNVNGVIYDLIIIDNDGNETYVGVHNTVTKYVPGLIKSPIIVLNKPVEDETAQPLDLSASYRIIEKKDGPYYWFTNTEREYFKPKQYLQLDSLPSDESGTVTIYLIDKDAEIFMDKMLSIKDYGGTDTINDNIDLFCPSHQYVRLTQDEFEEFGCYVYKDSGEIRFTGNFSEYQMIIVDYLKKDSYCINYKYNKKSYEVEISSSNKDTVDIIYDNTEITVDNYQYINEQKYINTGITPLNNCYVVIGR